MIITSYLSTVEQLCCLEYSLVREVEDNYKSMCVSTLTSVMCDSALFWLDLLWRLQFHYVVTLMATKPVLWCQWWSCNPPSVSVTFSQIGTLSVLPVSVVTFTVTWDIHSWDSNAVSSRTNLVQLPLQQLGTIFLQEISDHYVLGVKMKESFLFPDTMF